MKYILLLFILMPYLALSQNETKYYGIVPVPIQPKKAFKYESLNYKIVDVVDMQDNNSVLGEIYFGMLNHHVLYTIENGISENFMEYFYKALKSTKLGNREIVVAFKKLSINEKKENLGMRGGRLRNYEIEVEYYESVNQKLSYLYTDHQKIDSLSNARDFNIFKFCDNFFKVSLLRLNDFLEANPVIEEASIEGQDQLSQKNIVDSTASSYVIDTTSEKLKAGYVKKEVKAPPRIHHLVSFEKFEGVTAYGLRFRYNVFSREWDSLNWVGMFSMDVEATALNEDFDENSLINYVDYGYFAFGLAALKPLNNFFFLELGAKLALGKENIHLKSFYNAKSNTLFGIQLQQRIHFLLGKGFGLVLSVGTYENFYPTTVFLKSDFGISFGGGIKF